MVQYRLMTSTSMHEKLRKSLFTVYFCRAVLRISVTYLYAAVWYPSVRLSVCHVIVLY